MTTKVNDTPVEQSDVALALRRVEATLARYTSADAEDLVQEAVARAVAKGVRYDAEPWLKVVGRRLAIDRWRRQREFASGGTLELDLIAGPQDGDPAESVLRSERCEAVRRAMDTLPPRYRDALLVYLEEDGSAAGVARRFGLSPNAAWSLLSRARDRMRTELQRTGFAPALWGWLHRWRETLATGGVAVGLAVAVAVPSVTPADAPVPVQQASVRPVEVAVPVHDPAPVPAEAVPALPDPQAVVAAPALDDIHLPPAPAKYEASACVPDEAGGTEGSLEVWVQRDGGSLTSDVVEQLPDEVRRKETSGCDE